MKLKKYWKSRLILILAFCCLPTYALGVKPFAPTATEVAVLPPYCQARLRGDSSTMQMWSNRLGKGISPHLHHFCYGLNFMNRMMLTMDAREKGFYAASAVDEFNYVIKAWPPNHPLTREAIQYKMMVQSQQR